MHPLSIRPVLLLQQAFCTKLVQAQVMGRNPNLPPVALVTLSTGCGQQHTAFIVAVQTLGIGTGTGQHNGLNDVPLAHHIQQPANHTAHYQHRLHTTERPVDFRAILDTVSHILRLLMYKSQTAHTQPSPD